MFEYQNKKWHMQGTPGMNWLQILKTNDLPENAPVISGNINIVTIFKSLQ